MTNYCVIPTDKEALLEMHVQAFEAQNPHLTAVVVGIYLRSDLTEPNDNWRMLGRIRETIDTLDYINEIGELYGFVLLADNDQISSEIRELMLANGVQIMTNEEYIEFYNNLQNG